MIIKSVWQIKSQLVITIIHHYNAQNHSFHFIKLFKSVKILIDWTFLSFFSSFFSFFSLFFLHRYSTNMTLKDWDNSMQIHSGSSWKVRFRFILSKNCSFAHFFLSPFFFLLFLFFLSISSFCSNIQSWAGLGSLRINSSVALILWIKLGQEWSPKTPLWSLCRTCMRWTSTLRHLFSGPRSRMLPRMTQRTPPPSLSRSRRSGRVRMGRCSRQLTHGQTRYDLDLFLLSFLSC